MQSVRQRGTSPELVTRAVLRAAGIRYSLNSKRLPGTPDIVLPGPKKAIFVHGCFWHRHPRCKKSTMPKSNVEFWQAKFKANVRRDREKIAELRAIGFAVLVVWECETKRPLRLRSKLSKFLGSEIS